MFKTLKHIKKKILAAAMATAILVSGNIGINSGNHSITDTTVTVSARKVIYICPYCDDDQIFNAENRYYEHMASVHNADKCPYCGEFATRNRTALENHKKSCPKKPNTYEHDCKYKTHGCTMESFASLSRYTAHIEDCPYKNKCKFCSTDLSLYMALDYIMGTSYADDHVANCNKNPYRMLPKEKQFELQHSGFRIPTWDSDANMWVCPYCKIKFTDGLQTACDGCVKHIQSVHKLDAQLELLERSISDINQ